MSGNPDKVHITQESR